MAETASLTFPKRERIVSRKLIEQLFSKGSSQSTSAFPLRIVYMQQPPGGEPLQVLVSVSKRHFKHAVDRNRVKRQIREAYRRHRQLLSERIPEDKALAIAFIWLSDEHCDSRRVEKSVVRLLEKVAGSL
jgi:ribonuclease P protein component